MSILSRTKQAKPTKAFLRIALLGSVVAFAGESSATPQDSAPPQQKAPVKANFTNKQINKFVDAYVKVAKVGEKYQKELAKKKSDAEKRALMQNTNKKMMRILKEESIKPDVYNSIAKNMAQDSDLRQKVEQKLAKKMAAKQKDSKKK